MTTTGEIFENNDGKKDDDRQGLQQYDARKNDDGKSDRDVIIGATKEEIAQFNRGL